MTYIFYDHVWKQWSDHRMCKVQHPPCLESAKAFFLLQTPNPIIVLRFLGAVLQLQYNFVFCLSHKLHQVMNQQSFVASYDELNYWL